MSSYNFEEIEDHLNSDEQDEFVTDSDESDEEEANSENEQSFVTALEDKKSQSSIINGTPSSLSATSLSATSAFNQVRMGYKGQLYRTQEREKNTKSQTLRFAQIVGNDEAVNLLNEFYKFNENSGNDIARKALANGVISKIRYKYEAVTDRMIQEVFKIGSGRLNAIKKGKAYQLKPFKYNANALGKDDVKNLLDFTNTIPYETGYPCEHKRLKKYIELDDVRNISDLYPLYCAFLSRPEINARKMKSRTFHKYLAKYEPDLQTKRAMQDVCDFCIKIKVALQSKNLTEEEREHLLDMQEKHMTDSRTQRLLMRQVNCSIL